MNLRRLSPVFAFLAVAGVVGCSDDRAPLAPLGESSLFSGAAAVRDSHPPKPPKPEPIPIAAFNGSTSAEPGGTSLTSWTLGNDRNQDEVATWTLTGPPWAGLPQSGTLLVPKNGTAPLQIAVAVPDSTASGVYPIDLSVSLRRDSGSAGGFIQVVGDSIPPDSLRIGGGRSDR